MNRCRLETQAPQDVTNGVLRALSSMYNVGYISTPMATQHAIFLSIPGLRLEDVDQARTPTLSQWAGDGALAELVPTFPCVTSPVQATMITGTPPCSHGVIANGFYDRNRSEVEFWVASSDVVAGEPVWDALRRALPDFTSAVWHAQNIKGCSADFVVTPAPIHQPDGTTKPWCYSKPEGTYQKLINDLGHFPLQHYWGPLAGIESTRWILSAAAWLARKETPNFQWIYIPHLDYAAQKHGPNSPQAKQALVELDQALAAFVAAIGETSVGRDVIYIAAGEYALTDVVGAVFPNRLLREAGLLAVAEQDGNEYLDLPSSKAFAMVDHQFAHVFVRDADPGVTGRVCELLRSQPGIAGVYAGSQRREIGLEHKRSGELIVVTDDAYWLAYYWWLDEQAAPPFARTVDIHRKPGYDPVELFFDPDTKSIPLNAALVKGSHGVPATQAKHRTALICSKPSGAFEAGHRFRDADIKGLIVSLMADD